LYHLSLSKSFLDYFLENVSSSLAAERFALTRVWAGVDNAWEQEKLEARNSIESAKLGISAWFCSWLPNGLR
jgi:hypothetical protein